MKRFLIIVLAIFMVGLLAAGHCGHCQPGPTPIEPDGTEDCPAACARLQQLGCPEGDPLPDGTTCAEFCQETQRKGHALDPTCVKTIQTCEELETKCNLPQDGSLD